MKTKVTREGKNLFVDDHWAPSHVFMIMYLTDDIRVTAPLHNRQLAAGTIMWRTCLHVVVNHRL